METPTIIKQTEMTVAKKRLWKIIQQGEMDLREGRTIAARSIDEALQYYENRQWSQASPV